MAPLGDEVGGERVAVGAVPLGDQPALNGQCGKIRAACEGMAGFDSRVVELEEDSALFDVIAIANVDRFDDASVEMLDLLSLARDRNLRPLPRRSSR